MSGSGAASRTQPGAGALRRWKSRLATPDNCSCNEVAGSNRGNGDSILRGPGLVRPRCARGVLPSKELLGFCWENKVFIHPDAFPAGSCRGCRQPCCGTCRWEPGSARPGTGGRQNPQPLAFFGVKPPAPVSSL